MDIVHLLPDSVANQIAAGEVIQRPASCLKELVENSLDAGASHIQIILRDAGRTLLQVIDDGTGMSTTDARMAFERHATSKISNAADLFQLHTMGFRGEALASICAVATVEVQTRREEDELGTLLEISGSDVIRQEPVQCAKGTNMRVKNLFFNVPARRRFLKTDQTEMRNIYTEFARIVLVNPQVRFTLISQDEVVYDLKAGSDKQRIEAYFGHSQRHLYSSQLIDIHIDTELVNIHGFIGKPENASRNPQQFFFVNRRFMKHPYFHKAIMTAYQGLLHNDTTPSYFIYFTLPPESIDVNIHPTKTEVKFADEQLIFPILLSTVREALGKYNIIPSLDFDTTGKIEMPLQGQNKSFSTPAFLQHDKTYNPFHPPQPSVDSHWKSLYDIPQTKNEYNVIHNSDNTPSTALFETESDSVHPYQLNNRYIVLPQANGLLLIDQHRAHALVLYEQCLKRLKDHNGEVQQLLFPEIWDVGVADEYIVDSITDYLHSLGFELNRLTRGSYNISGVPAILGNQSPLSALQQILDSVREIGNIAQDERERRIAWSMADSSAIPYGKSLTQNEMTTILTQLNSQGEYNRTPNGKPVSILFSNEQINSLF